MKNLANCSPREFLKQTHLIKASAEGWFKLNDIENIRKKMPSLKSLDGLNEEDREQAIEENKKAVRAQAMKNLMEIIENATDKNADATVELLALCCFIDPADADKHSMSEYLECIGDLLSDQGVLSFFTSLVQLAQKNILTVSNQ